MKKITLIILFLIVTSLSHSQVVLSEDFNAALALPAGWTNNDIAGSGEIWEFETGGNAPYVGTTSLYTEGNFSGNYPIFNSDGYGNNGTAEEAALESPVFSCSALTNVTLSFNNFFVSGYGGEGYVEVYDGTQWIEVVSFSELNVTADTYTSAPVSVDVSTELAGVANAQVRFRWVGDWSYYWAFDDVSVFQCTVTSPNQATVDAPVDGAVDVPIIYGSDNIVGPFEWTDATTGDPVDSYNFNLGVTSSGNDIGSIPGFSSGGNILYDFQPGTTYYWSVDAVNCAGVTPGTVWSFTTASCTETTAPAAATTPVPADAATAVILEGPDGSLSFNWTAANPNDFFTLNLGTSNPPTQVFDDFENGGTITGLAVSTTYYWSVDVHNCFGTTTGSVWSFTTDALLSVEDNEISLFKIYPNPVNDILNINTSLKIEQIDLFDLLGKKVMSFERNTIHDNAINISELSKGIYMAIISAEGKTQTVKITKK